MARDRKLFTPARDLLALWNEEMRAQGEPVTAVIEAILATVEVA